MSTVWCYCAEPRRCGCGQGCDPFRACQAGPCVSVTVQAAGADRVAPAATPCLHLCICSVVRRTGARCCQTPRGHMHDLAFRPALPCPALPAVLLPPPPPPRCQEQQDGWRQLTVRPASPQDKQLLLQLQRDRDAAVVVLTQHPQQQNKQQRRQQQLSDGSPAPAAAARLTGLVSRWDLVEGQDQLLVRVRPWCGAHAWGSGPCCQVRDTERKGIRV